MFLDDASVSSNTFACIEEMSVNILFLMTYPIIYLVQCLPFYILHNLYRYDFLYRLALTQACQGEFALFSLVVFLQPSLFLQDQEVHILLSPMVFVKFCLSILALFLLFLFLHWHSEFQLIIHL